MKYNRAEQLVVYALGLIYIVFGFLKVVNHSPIRDLVVAMGPFMDKWIFFQLFGMAEIVLGIGLLVPSIRKWAALGIVLHMISTLALFVVVPHRLFNPFPYFTLEGEFVSKNFLLIAVAYFIWQKETSRASK